MLSTFFTFFIFSLSSSLPSLPFYRVLIFPAISISLITFSLSQFRRLLIFAIFVF
ncbi:unnamed protein product [Amoebophrya sp. A25]|nr:unnamed protein product [Amoebophrya sp. A25]|eukprot:GSA25T00017234001.1